MIQPGMLGTGALLSTTDKRVELLDVLRGIAILGMFMVNMTADIWWSDLYGDLDPGSADFVSLVLVSLFASGKFITIFAFLFGIGFYVQSERLIANGGNVTSFWLRRLVGLLVIGVVAISCTLPVRILIDYALFGVGLLFFYKLSPRNILIAAISCFVIATLYGLVIPTYWPPIEADVPSFSEVLESIHGSPEMVQRDGSFLAISALSIRHLWEELTQWRYYFAELDILGLMLLGLYIGRRGGIWDRDIQVALARKALPWLLGIGFLGCATWVAIEDFGIVDDYSIHHSVISDLMAWPIGMPTLGLGYAAAVTLLMDSEKWRRRLAAFAPMGRMALTNYLFIGFVEAFISLQWGLGLFGEVFPTAGLLIVVALLPVQLLVSRWWLNRFAFGPFEWLWRSWTYGQFPPMRI